MQHSHPLIRPALLLLMMSAMIWCLVVLLLKIQAGRTQEFDERLIVALRSTAYEQAAEDDFSVEHFARDVTSLGSSSVVIMGTVAFGLYLLLLQRRGQAILLIAMTATGIGAYYVLKYALRRPRPEIISHLVDVDTPSLPSGHATLAALFYVGLAFRAAQHVGTMRLKTYLIAAAFVLTLAIGFTRVYLGVHWPTDVLAGWLLGLAWVMLWWLIEWAAMQRKPRAPVPINNEQASPTM